MMLACGADALFRRTSARAAGAFALAAVVALGAVSLPVPAYPKEDFRAMLAVVDANIRPEDAILLYPKARFAAALYTDWPFHLRGPVPGASVTTPFDLEIDRPRTFVPVDTVPVHFATAVDQATRASRRIWYVGTHGGADWDSVAKLMERAGFVLKLQRGFQPHYYVQLWTRPIPKPGREHARRRRRHRAGRPGASRSRPPARCPSQLARLRRLERLAVVLALIGVFAGLYASYPRPWRKEPVFTSPRQSVGYELAASVGEDRQAGRDAATVRQGPGRHRPAFTPRDAASRNGQVVPKDFPLVVAMFAAAHKINSNIVPFVVPFMAVLALIVFALLAWELTRSRIAVWMAGILFASTTSFWSSSSWIYAPDTAAVCVVLLAVYAFVRASRSSRLAWDVVGGLACAAAFGFRYDNAVIVSVLWFAFLLADRRKRHFVVPVVAGSGSIPFLVFNKWLYGSPHTTGYGLAYKLIDQTANIKGRGLLGVSSSIFTRQVDIYLMRPEVLALLVAGARRDVRRPAQSARAVDQGAGLGHGRDHPLIIAYAGTRNLTGATRSPYRRRSSATCCRLRAPRDLRGRRDRESRPGDPGHRLRRWRA